MPELKHTKQRMAILKFLTSQPDPATAEDIFRALHSDFPNLALSTIYRNLERFTEVGILKKEIFMDGIIRYSPLQEHGHYLICTGCDRKIRLDTCPLAKMEKELERNTGFEIDGHSLTIYGKCPDCLHRKEKNSFPST